MPVHQVCHSQVCHSQVCHSQVCVCCVLAKYKESGGSDGVSEVRRDFVYLPKVPCLHTSSSSSNSNSNRLQASSNEPPAPVTACPARLPSACPLLSLSSSNSFLPAQLELLQLQHRLQHQLQYQLSSSASFLY
jgi:hypothetical protein